MSDPPHLIRGERVLAVLPRVLVGLGIGCSISGIAGFVAILVGSGTPHVAWLLMPPIVALLLVARRELQDPGPRRHEEDR